MSRLTRKISGVGEATRWKIFIKNAARIVRENRLLHVEMRETIELARRRGCEPWKINSTSWRRAIKS
jgi:hypothetical protein